jgi:hypothetical protein
MAVLTDDTLYFTEVGDGPKTLKLMEKLRQTPVAQLERELSKFIKVPFSDIVQVIEPSRGHKLIIHYKGSRTKAATLRDPRGKLKLFKKLHARVAPGAKIHGTKPPNSWRILAEDFAITIPVTLLALLIDYFFFWRGHDRMTSQGGAAVMITFFTCFFLFVGYFAVRQKWPLKRSFSVESTETNEEVEGER